MRHILAFMVCMLSFGNLSGQLSTVDSTFIQNNKAKIPSWKTAKVVYEKAIPNVPVTEEVVLTTAAKGLSFTYRDMGYVKQVVVNGNGKMKMLTYSEHSGCECKVMDIPIPPPGFDPLNFVSQGYKQTGTEEIAGKVATVWTTSQNGLLITKAIWDGLLLKDAMASLSVNSVQTAQDVELDLEIPLSIYDIETTFSCIGMYDKSNEAAKRSNVPLFKELLQENARLFGVKGKELSSVKSKPEKNTSSSVSKLGLHSFIPGASTNQETKTSAAYEPEPVVQSKPADNESNSTKTEIKPVATTKSFVDVDINIPSTGKINYNAFALIIGNEKYLSEIQVDHAVNDASVFKKYVQQTLGVPEKNIHLVLNASYGMMLSEIKWLEDVAKAMAGDAEIIFYYAGHGMPDEATKSAYLLPVDGSSAMLQVAISLKDVYARLNTYPTKRTTVFLDACFSGSARGGMLASGRGVAIRPKEEALKQNMVVFSAVTGEQTAHPYREKQHGLFTYFLLEKLQDSKGEATLQELEAYLKKEVVKYSILENRKEQTPQLQVSPTLGDRWKSWKLK